MISNKYRELYITSTQEQLKELADLFLSLDKNMQNKNILMDIFRSLHSMKGAAATMAYNKTVDFIHNFESIIQAAIAGKLNLNKDLLDLFITLVDHLQDNLHSISSQDKERDFRQDNGDLQKILKQPSNKIIKLNNLSSKKEESSDLVSSRQISDLSLAVSSLDQVQDTMDDLLVSIMSIKARALKNGQVDLLASVLSADTLANNLRRQLERLRVISLSTALSTLPYLVRSVAKDENKKVKLVIEDNNLSLDKSMVDDLLEIIIQLVKNSVVHGIKTKQSNGQINVAVNLMSDHVVVKVSDNGQGIDWHKVKILAIKKKIVSSSQAAKLSAAQILNLLFHVNMSSQKHLDINAGRGVGLSLVKSKVFDLNGTIQVQSVVHKGTTFTMKFPLPLSIFKSLSFQIGDWVLAIPLSQVDKVVRLPELKDVSKDKFFTHHKQRLKLVSILKILPLEKFSSLAKYILYLKTEDGLKALPIFGNLKESELVMKPSPAILNHLSYLRGVAVSSAGRPVLIIDVNKLN